MINKKLTLHTEFTFDSAHYLEGHEGKCKNIHGHTWHIDVWISGSIDQLDNVGILFDFGEIKEIKDKLDHKLLNEVIAHLNPTAENICRYVHKSLQIKRKDLNFKVRVYETKIGKETWCEYGQL